MMRFFLTMTLFFCVNSLLAQKPVIDTIAYKKWPSLYGVPIISKNGLYVFYNIEGSKTSVVQSTDGKWKKEFDVEVSGERFSDKYFLFTKNADSLGMLTLGTDQIKYIPNTSWWALHEIEDVEYLWRPSATNPKNLLLGNLKNNKEQIFTDVDSWEFKDDMLVLLKSSKIDKHKQSINVVNIATGTISKVWEGYEPEELVLDSKSSQLAFKTGDSVWCYKMGSSSPVCIVDQKSLAMQPGFSLGHLNSFSKDGKSLFVSLLEKNGIKLRKGAVEIWSYQDITLPSEQQTEINIQSYIAAIDISARKIIRLQQQKEESLKFPMSKDAPDTYALVENFQKLTEPWSIGYKCSWSLVNTKNSVRKVLSPLNNIPTVNFSAGGKFLVYFDREQRNYFSYEIATGKIRNLTKDVPDISSPDKWYNGATMNTLPRTVQIGGVTAWTKDDKSLLLYDQYDIWELDPLNIRRPVNVTNGYGKRNGLIFHLALKEYDQRFIEKNETLILNCFNLNNKDNGYYGKRLGESGDPYLQTMGPYVFDLIGAGYLPVDVNFPPIKATKSDVFVVRRMSATDAPNYFSTKDFKTFTRLSDLQPQKKYNWYTTELHTWKSLDGRKLQGILYKPENFDPNKRYPVIFHYYQRKSEGLNCYIKPEALADDGGSINISNYVSNGYLVFSPDIYYTESDPMQGTYDAVVSAANYIANLPFINSKKMGLQGNSFGGVQTNYLVTHTDLFAAAESSAGLADFVSAYGTLQGGTSPNNYFYEIGQLRFGGSLWEKPAAYIKNSAIFQVHKVTTPLLLMHCKSDDIANILELFTGLRRMGKKAWLLSYSEGNHGVWGKEADDLSIRMMQFFDHYLKDKPAPLWMLDGVNVENRSGEASLKLDTKGRTPGPGLLTPEQQKKVDWMMNREPITITLK